MSDYPLITIGITCFNAEDTIARAITSAQRQDWQNFEIVVVDDASSDQSVRIIKEMGKKDSRIHLYCHDQNQGCSAARNTITKQAKGKYIAFLDDDDECKTERLSKQYERLSQFEKKQPDSPVLCYCHARTFKGGKEIRLKWGTGYMSPEPHGVMVADRILWDRKVSGYSWGTPGLGTGLLMVSKDILERFKFDLDFKLFEDWELAVRVALAGGYFIAVNEVLVNIHITSSSDKSNEKALRYRLRICHKYKDYLKKNHVYWCAIFRSYTAFYFSTNNLWRGWMFRFLSRLVSLHKFGLSGVGRRIPGSWKEVIK